MYILLEVCQQPGVLRVLYFVTLLLDIIFVLVPIGLILMLTIDFSKALVVGEEKTEKSIKLVSKRIVYAILIFCTPWIVSVFMGFLEDIGVPVDYNTCIENAKSKNFSYYDKLLEEEERLYKEQKAAKDTADNLDNNKGNNGNSGNTGKPGSTDNTGNNGNSGNTGNNGNNDNTGDIISVPIKPDDSNNTGNTGDTGNTDENTISLINQNCQISNKSGKKCYSERSTTSSVKTTIEYQERVIISSCIGSWCEIPARGCYITKGSFVNCTDSNNTENTGNSGNSGNNNNIPTHSCKVATTGGKKCYSERSTTSSVKTTFSNNSSITIESCERSWCKVPSNSCYVLKGSISNCSDGYTGAGSTSGNNGNDGNSGNTGDNGNSGNTGGTGTSTTVDSGMLRLAANTLVTTVKGQVGNNNNDSKYGGKSSGWCGNFALWAIQKTKLSNGTTLYNYLKQNGSIGPAASGLWPAFQGTRLSNVKFYYSKAYGGSYTPKPGDFVWYQWAPSDGGYCRSNYGTWDKKRQCSDHVEIVVGVSGNKLLTVGGNTGSPGQVRERERTLTSDTIIAYGTFY